MNWFNRRADTATQTLMLTRNYFIFHVSSVYTHTRAISVHLLRVTQCRELICRRSAYIAIGVEKTNFD